MENNEINNVEVVEQSTSKNLLGGIVNFLKKPAVKVGLIIGAIVGGAAIYKKVKGKNEEIEGEFDEIDEDEIDEDDE